MGRLWALLVGTIACAWLMSAPAGATPVLVSAINRGYWQNNGTPGCFTCSCADYFVGTCHDGACPGGGCIARDYFVFCTTGLKADGTVCSVSFQAAAGGFCSCPPRACQQLELHQVCTPVNCLLNCDEYGNLAGPTVYFDGTVTSTGCRCHVFCLTLDGCAVAQLCTDIQAGTPFVLAGTDVCACTCDGKIEDDIFSGTGQSGKPTRLSIVFTPAAGGGAPELDSQAGVLPCLALLGLLAAIERRRQARTGTPV